MCSGFLLDSFSGAEDEQRRNREGIEKTKSKSCQPSQHLCKPSHVSGNAIPKKKQFREEITNRHGVFRMPSQVWSKAGTFLTKRGSCCYTFVSSVTVGGVSPRANGRANPLTFSCGCDRYKNNFINIQKQAIHGTGK
jgi:hypothetical protein